ncbi:MAG: DUF3951 domain-containing protein [Halobacillus sp.]|uniref:DUF3951 domain-containing protein n=1 Tax=Halobacillus sp. TaxID=56800 RepID=UPI003BAE4701
MILNAFGILIVGAALCILIILVAYKLFVKKESIDTTHSYTPFDYITGQTSQEFHEEEDFLQEEEKDPNEKP